MLSVEALGPENKNERRDRRKVFSVHFSGWFTSTHVNHLLRLFLGKKMFLTNVCFEKCNKKGRSLCLLRRFNGPNFYACTGTNQVLHYIGLRYILLRLEAWVFKVALVKT